MPPARVVPALDEVEDGEACLGRCREPLPIEQLALERREEALAERVVVGIADRAHRGPGVGLTTAEPEGDRRVLAALIRVMNDVGGPTLLDGHVQRGPGRVRSADAIRSPRRSRAGSTRRRRPRDTETRPGSGRT